MNWYVLTLIRIILLVGLIAIGIDEYLYHGFNPLVHISIIIVVLLGAIGGWKRDE